MKISVSNKFRFVKTLAKITTIAVSLAGTLILPAESQADSPPQIVVQPQNQMVVDGSSAVFSVSATGDGLNYQWYLNGTFAVPGATNDSLALTNVGATQAGEYSVSVTNLSGGLISSNASLTVLMVTNPIDPYEEGTFGYDLFENTYLLASSTNKTGTFSPPSANLGTNSAVWTWPINLSCVGYASDGYESVLITSDKLLTCAHYGGESGQTVTFHDTNGVAWVGVVTNVINVIADMDIAELSNAAPASIVIPYVLPPDYTNYIANNSLLGMPAFWLHKNTAHIDYVVVNSVLDADLYGYGTWMNLLHNGYGLYSGTSATGGDSGSPAFLSLNNNPILLYATTLSGDTWGMFVSGETNWNSLAARGLTNGMKILDLSGYPLQSTQISTLVPPTNQMASPGVEVTFYAGLDVSGAPPFTYQWQFDGTNLAGATNDTLTIQAEPANVGDYTVIVSNALGSVTIGPATLQLQVQPTDTPLLPIWGRIALALGLVALGKVFLSDRHARNLK
jgi:hypothetical protein